MKKPYRQGDVLILPVKSFPKGLKKVTQCTLALGEATGHHHTLADAIGWGKSKDSLADFFEVISESADLTHQEHDTISLPKGKYRKVIQVESYRKEIKKVVD